VVLWAQIKGVVHLRLQSAVKSLSNMTSTSSMPFRESHAFRITIAESPKTHTLIKGEAKRFPCNAHSGNAQNTVAKIELSALQSSFRQRLLSLLRFLPPTAKATVLTQPAVLSCNNHGHQMCAKEKEAPP
jgi:hypothetical protein